MKSLILSMYIYLSILVKINKKIRWVSIIITSSFGWCSTYRMKTDLKTRYQLRMAILVTFASLAEETSMKCKYYQILLIRYFFTTFWYLLSTTELIDPAQWCLYAHYFHTFLFILTMNFSHNNTDSVSIDLKAIVHEIVDFCLQIAKVVICILYPLYYII